MLIEFDEKSMTFKNLSQEQKEELKDEVLNIVVHGKANIEYKYFSAWARHFGYDTPDKALLLMTTAYPQRAMLCLI